MSHSIQPGNFSALKLNEWDRTMVEDAYKAVNMANAWDFLRRPDVPGAQGFMLSDWPELRQIDKNIKYEGHSGASYGMTMRLMEFIAKNGWNAYVESVGFTNIVEKALSVDTLICSVPIEEIGNALTFTNYLRSDERMRRLIPDIDQQAEALQDFSEGTMSYSEMRSRCG